MKTIGFASNEKENKSDENEAVETHETTIVPASQIIDEYYKSIKWYILAVFIAGVALGGLITWGITYAYNVKHFANLGAYIQTTETAHETFEKIVIDVRKINPETDVWKE